MSKKRFSKYLTHDQIRKIAEACIETIKKESLIDMGPPVPIEDIVDIHFGIDIIPHPFLIEQHDQDASISRDCSEMRVDKQVYDHKNTNRYRFSLAHELGHMCLHQHLLESAEFSDVTTWISFLRSEISDEDHKWLERQANAFAGFLMVPRDHLTSKHEQIIVTLADNGYDVSNMSPEMLKGIAKQIGDYFGVSWSVIRSRGDKENLWQWDDFPPD